jgi:hypothetical protein
MEAGRTYTDRHLVMASIDLIKHGAPRPPALRARRLQAYIMLAFGVVDLLERSPIGVVFLLLGFYFLLRSRTASDAAPGSTPDDSRRADQAMVDAATALPDWWTVDQYRARVVPVGDAAQPAFPLVDLQGQVTGVLARADLDRLAPVEVTDVRLRDLARRGRARPMVLVAPDSSLRALAGPIALHDAIGVVVGVDKRPLGVITRSEMAHATDLTG